MANYSMWLNRNTETKLPPCRWGYKANQGLSRVNRILAHVFTWNKCLVCVVSGWGYNQICIPLLSLQVPTHPRLWSLPAHTAPTLFVSLYLCLLCRLPLPTGGFYTVAPKNTAAFLQKVKCIKPTCYWMASHQLGALKIFNTRAYEERSHHSQNGWLIN